MTSRNLPNRSGSWNVRFPALSLAVIMILVLSVASCKTSRQIQVHDVSESNQRTDSVSLVTERLMKAIPVPASRATLTLSFDSLLRLPVGAGYTEKQGQATVAVLMTEGGMIEASANCDSLTLLVEEMKTEIFHLNKEKTELKSELNEQKIIEVNRLTGWQWFQVWTGRICLILIAGILIIKLIKII
jgi:hypothetical protein